MDTSSETKKREFKKRLYEFVLKLVQYISNLPKNSVNDVMGKQLLRSGTSILANYVEATAASSRKEFINFFQYSLKSANESKVWIELLRDTQKGNGKNEWSWFLQEADSIARILAKSIITLKKQ